MQHDRKEWAPGDSGWAEVGREETGAGQLMGDSREERGKGEEGTKGAGGNKTKKKSSDKAPAESGSRPEKIAQMLSMERKGWERRRGAEGTKVRHQSSGAEGRGAESSRLKGRGMNIRGDVKPGDGHGK